MKLSEASHILGEDMPIQGNLDPEILAGPASTLRTEVTSILDDAKNIKHYAFNLGHGILPHTTPENVSLVIDTVRAYKR